MSEFLPIKSIYTGADVTALGEAAPNDVMLAPDGGIKYPDGSIQLSAQSGGGTLVEEVPPNAPPKATWFESDSGRMYLLYNNPDGKDVWVEANAAGTRGLTGATGSVGPQGERGLQGEAGVQGIQGETGLAGEKGDTGDAGPSGAKGDTGDIGPAGAEGLSAYEVAVTNGYAGTEEEWLDSLKGETGPAGAKGDTGDAGPIGPEGPQGETGETGPIGVGIVFRGRVPTVADLPATAAQGDMWVVDETGDAWVWSDTLVAFENVGPIVGPAGQQGPKGDTGETGAAGPAGADGAQGPAGLDGATGPQGPAGADSQVAGPQGPAGANGADGAGGPQGPQGPQGEMGPAGPADWNAIPNKPPLWTQSESDTRYVYKTGDTMSGALTVAMANANMQVMDYGGSVAAFQLGFDGGIHANYLISRSGQAVIGTDSAWDLLFKVGGVGRGRFNTNGQFLVQQETPPHAWGGSVVAMGYTTKAGHSAGPEGFVFNLSWNGVMNLWLDNVNLGIISLTSDYRIKDNATPLETALDKVMALKPITYTMKTVGEIFKESPRKLTGFLAHECEHIEGAVEGVKDELTSDGGVQPQRLNPMPLISTLAKAMQEQQAMIESQAQTIGDLTARLVALEAK